MFNGVAEQIQQLIASSTTLVPLHVSSPHLFSPFNPTPSINDIASPPSSHLLLQSHFRHLLSSQEKRGQEETEADHQLPPCNRGIDLEGDRSGSDRKSRWLEEEAVGEMRRVRSNLEDDNNGYSNSTLISRKLAEHEFIRSSAENFQEKSSEGQVASKPGTFLLNLEENSGNEITAAAGSADLNRKRSSSWKKKKKKKKRRKSCRDVHLEKMKGFCEEMVKKMMVQQEELHSKFLEDVERKDHERVAREETWKKQEMARIDREIEIRAEEQALACTREATIISFLNKFTSTHDKPIKTPTSSSSSQNPSSVSVISTNNNNTELPISSNPSAMLMNSTVNPNSLSNHDVLQLSRNEKSHEGGRRWPKAEVYSLISLRCNLLKSQEEMKGSCKVSLWERISQGMMELGYHRSAKRCKEKWENINKYFKKTKGTSKKRSPGSKTCPYFHQLTTLYSEGASAEPQENCARPHDNLTDSMEEVMRGLDIEY